MRARSGGGCPPAQSWKMMYHGEVDCAMDCLSAAVCGHLILGVISSVKSLRHLCVRVVCRNEISRGCLLQQLLEDALIVQCFSAPTSTACSLFIFYPYNSRKERTHNHTHTH